MESGRQGNEEVPKIKIIITLFSAEIMLQGIHINLLLNYLQNSFCSLLIKFSFWIFRSGTNYTNLLLLHVAKM